MRFVHYLQHWLDGTGVRLQITDFVPVMQPIHQWADTFPWAALVSAIEQSFAQRFPNKSLRGRRAVPIRVLFALELLKHALGASDEESCQPVRTDFAVMDACGLGDYQGNPRDPSYVLPLLDQVQQAIERLQAGPQRPRHAVAGDLEFNDTVVRQARHTRGMLTVGRLTTVEPIKVNPSAQDVRAILNAAGLPRKRPPSQVHLACASSYSRPVVESHIASVLSRGAGPMRYKGLEATSGQ